MADDALFGPDGTQAPVPFPLLADPLGGLVTGELFPDTEPAPVAEATPTVEAPAPTPTIRRSGVPGRGRPKRVSAVRTGQAPEPPKAFPAAPAIAPTRTGAVQRPLRTATVGTVPARDVALGNPRARRTPPGRSQQGQRSSGAAGLVIFLIFIVIVAVIVLGIVAGHGGGVGSGGG